MQKKLLDINSITYYISYTSRTLNLTLCDIANTFGKAIERFFYNSSEYLYNIYQLLIILRDVFKNNVKKLTIKSWSTHVGRVVSIV